MRRNVHRPNSRPHLPPFPAVVVSRSGKPFRMRCRAYYIGRQDRSQYSPPASSVFYFRTFPLRMHYKTQLIFSDFYSTVKYSASTVFLKNTKEPRPFPPIFFQKKNTQKKYCSPNKLLYSESYSLCYVLRLPSTACRLPRQQHLFVVPRKTKCWCVDTKKEACHADVCDSRGHPRERDAAASGCREMTAHRLLDSEGISGERQGKEFWSWHDPPPRDQKEES